MKKFDFAFIGFRGHGMNSIKENWDLIKDTLRKEYELSDISYKTWVMPLDFYSEKNDIVTIVIPSDQAHALKYITNKYKSFFQVTISEMMNHTYDISFILEKDTETEEKTAAKAVYNINYQHDRNTITDTFFCNPFTNPHQKCGTSC